MAKGKKVKTKKEKKEKQQREYKPLKTYFTQKTFLGVTLVGVLALVAVYVFVYTDYSERTTELTASNQELQAVVTELEEYNTNIEQYQIEIKEMEMEINAILDQYPSDAREEDMLMLAVNLQERNTIDFDAINMDDTEVVYTVEPYLTQAVEMEGLLNEGLIFKQKQAVYVNETTYPQLKEVIKQVYESDNRIGINNIVYTKNEEFGILEGNFDIYFYSIAGIDKEYVAPDITPYIRGTEDPFKSEEIAQRIALDILDEMTDEEGGLGGG